MAASDNDPLSAAGLAAALEAGADTSGTGGKPVSAGNLKALVDGGKIGAVDVLYQGDGTAKNVALTSPMENYDLVLAVVRSATKYSVMGGATYIWHMSEEEINGWHASMQGIRVDSQAYGTSSPYTQQTGGLADMKCSGTSMSTGASGSANGIVLVIGIKTVGGGFS